METRQNAYANWVIEEHDGNGTWTMKDAFVSHGCAQSIYNALCQNDTSKEYNLRPTQEWECIKPTLSRYLQ